jgi:hypothetical protein
MRRLAGRNENPAACGVFFRPDARDGRRHDMITLPAARNDVVCINICIGGRQDRVSLWQTHAFLHIA